MRILIALAILVLVVWTWVDMDSDLFLESTIAPVLIILLVGLMFRQLAHMLGLHGTSDRDVCGFEYEIERRNRDSQSCSNSEGFGGSSGGGSDGEGCDGGD